MLITPAAITDLHTTFNTIYQSAYNDTPNWYQKIATVVQSSSTTNTYGWMARIANVRPWIGPRVIQNLTSHSQIVVNEPYELTVSVGRDAWEDSNLGTYAPTFQMLGQKAAQWPDTTIANFIQSNPVGFDGLTFFNNAHTLDPAGVQDNEFALALTAANYATVREAMMGYTGEDGQPLEVMPNTLFVPPQLEYEGRTILAADIIADPGGAGGVTNVLKGSAELVVVRQWANEPTRWYLADTSNAIKPFGWQLRRAMQLVAKAAPTDDNVFWNGDLVWGVDGRAAAFCSLWFLCARSTG